MLVLGRKVGEVICIGDEIEVMLTEIRDLSNAKIGVTAPGVKVYRKEIYEQIQQERAHDIDETEKQQPGQAEKRQA